MTLPESAYRSGILCVEPDEEFEAQEAVHGYHAGRSVCVAKKQEMTVIWYIMLALAGLDLFMADSWTGSHAAEWLSLIMYAALIWYFVRSVMKRRNE